MTAVEMSSAIETWDGTRAEDASHGRRSSPDSFRRGKHYTPKGSVIQDTESTPTVKVASADDVAIITERAMTTP